MLHIGIYLYGQIAKRRTSVCFQHARPNTVVCTCARSGRILFGRVLHVESKHRNCASLCHLSNIDIFQICNTKQCMYKTKYVLLHHSRTYTNVYIGIGSTCMFKCNFNRTAFIKVRLAQSVEQRATISRLCSSPTVDMSNHMTQSVPWCHCHLDLVQV